MEWKDAYSVGVAEIDRDHQILVELLTRVEQSVAQGKPPAQILASIEQLMNMTRAHFDQEVATMRMCGYPAVEEHIKGHKRFFAELKDLETRTFGGAAWTETLRWLRTWMDDHMSASDKQYALFVRRGYK